MILLFFYDEDDEWPAKAADDDSKNQNQRDIGNREAGSRYDRKKNWLSTLTLTQDERWPKQQAKEGRQKK